MKKYECGKCNGYDNMTCNTNFGKEICYNKERYFAGLEPIKESLYEQAKPIVDKLNYKKGLEKEIESTMEQMTFKLD